MASVKKYSNRKFWYACYRDALGKQHTKSTGIEHNPPLTKKDEENGVSPKQKQADFKRQALQFAATLEATERGNPTEAHLRKVFAEISERITGQALEFPNARKFLNDWIDSRKSSEGTIKRYRGTIDAFVDSLEAKAKLPLGNINSTDINKFALSRLKDGRTASTVSTDLKCLNIPFNSALRQGLILTNPVAAADPIESSQETREPFTRAEVQKLLNAASGTPWETAILLAAYAGLRLGDAVSLKWESIDFFQHKMTLRPKKTSRKKVDLTLPLSGTLEAHLQALKPTGEAKGYITPDLANMRSSGKSGLSMAFNRIMEKAEVSQSSVKAEGEKGKTKGRTFNKKTFHSLRHFFITQLEEKGVAPDLRQKLAGHSSDRVHGRYTHTELETLRKAVSGI